MSRPASDSQMRALVDEFYSPLFRYAFHLAGSAADAEDLTQETFCKAQTNWRQLREPERVRPWLYAILRNCYLRQKRDERGLKLVGLEFAAAQVRPAHEDPALPADPERLRSALLDLPESYRTPLILYYFDGFTYRDIADQMAVPIGTVMSRLARAKAYLRERLAPAGAGVNGDVQ